LFCCAAFGRNARVGAVATKMVAIPKVPYDGAAVTGPSGPTLPGDGDLDFLEAKP
jgi:hypothetical protein